MRSILSLSVDSETYNDYYKVAEEYPKKTPHRVIVRDLIKAWREQKRKKQVTG